jgi:hypothetical protein
MDDHRILARPVLVPWEMGTAISDSIRIQAIGFKKTQTARLSKLLALCSISLAPTLTTIQKSKNQVSPMRSVRDPYLSAVRCKV